MSRPLFDVADASPRLRIFSENDPVVLPFPARRQQGWPFALKFRKARRRFAASECAPPAEKMDPLSRARILHANRCCPHCHRAGVVPLDLGDGDERHRAMPVPGTSTLVGFYCDACGAEWSV